jgi:hypothetical protein
MVARPGQGRATHARLGLVALSCDPKLQVPSFFEKNPWYFIQFYFLRKQIERSILLKATSDSVVLCKYGEILQQIFEQSAWKSRYI